MRKGQLDDDPRLQGIDANRAGSAFKDEDGKVPLNVLVYVWDMHANPGRTRTR